MDYVLTFLEGLATFVSPCLLPMLPIYISYFAGTEQKNVKRTLLNSIGFVLGFTIVFVGFSVLINTVGSNFISKNINILKLIFGVLIIILGLNYMGIFKLGFLNKTKKFKIRIENFNFFTAMIFGMLFSISWTPCVGAFLSSAFLILLKSS